MARRGRVVVRTSCPGGALVSVPDMPWSYLPTLFALQLPEVLIVRQDEANFAPD